MDRARSLALEQSFHSVCVPDFHETLGRLNQSTYNAGSTSLGAFLHFPHRVQYYLRSRLGRRHLGVRLFACRSSPGFEFFRQQEDEITPLFTPKDEDFSYDISNAIDRTRLT